MMSFWVVVPTYNEHENIAKLIGQILDTDRRFHVLVVDDNSPDGTAQLVSSIASEESRCRLMVRPGKLGLGTAYVEGFRYALAAGADLVFQMDGDLSHDPSYLPSFLEAIEDADLVIGSRYCEGVRVVGWRFRRLLLSKFACMAASYVLTVPVWDVTAGFRCWRRDALEMIDLDAITSDGYAFQIEMLHCALRRRLRVREVPIIFLGRARGYSKLSRGVVWEAIRLLWRLRAPVHRMIRRLKYVRRDFSEFIEDYYRNPRLQVSVKARGRTAKHPGRLPSLMPPATEEAVGTKSRRAGL